jgi:hypothetical protein
VRSLTQELPLKLRMLRQRREETEGKDPDLSEQDP